MGGLGREVGEGALRWEYEDRSVGMEAWGWEHEDTVGQISQISIVQSLRQISQISIVQSASLRILCYCSIGISWMVPSLSFWVSATLFILLSQKHCATIFLLYFVDLSVLFGFVCHAGHCFILIVCYCELSLFFVFYLFFSHGFEHFPTIYLLLSFKLYQNIVSAYDMLFLKNYFCGAHCLFLCNMLVFYIFLLLQI